MATLLLPIAVEGVVGSILSGVSGTAVTATLTQGSYALIAGAGALIDNLVLYPRLLGSRDDTQGQRLQDLQIQETAEGSPQNRCWGQAARVSGTLVWLTDLREVKDSQSQGKGGSGGEYISYRYFASMMVQACKGPISRFPKVWADGKTFFIDEPELNVTSTGIAGDPETSQVFGTTVATVTLILSAALADADLTKLESGQLVKVSGFVGAAVPFSDAIVSANPADNNKGDSFLTINSATGGALLQDDTISVDGHPTSYQLTSNQTVSAGVDKQLPVVPDLTATLPDGAAVTIGRGGTNNNGTWRVISSQLVDPTPGAEQVEARLRNPANKAHPFATRGAGDTVTYVQSRPNYKASQAGDVRFLLGQDFQQADPLVVSHERNVVGDEHAQVYGMNLRAGMVVEDCALTEFGNRAPSFEFLVEEQPDRELVRDVVKEICQEALSEMQIDVSALPDTMKMIGFAIRGPQPPRISLQPILKTFGILGRQIEGRIEFLDRRALTEVEIPRTALSCGEEGQDVPRPLAVGQPDDRVVPSELLLRYNSEETDYQTSAVRSRRTEPSGAPVTVDVRPLVLDIDVAQQAADRDLALLQVARREFHGALSPEFIGEIQEGDVAKVLDVYGRDWRILIERLERGANHVLLFQGRKEQASALVQTATAEAGNTPSKTGATQDGPWARSAFVEYEVAEIPALREEEAQRFGVYVGVANAAPNRPWRGASMFVSFERGTGFRPIASFPREAVLGTVLEQLADQAPEGEKVWDPEARALVRIRHPQAQLSSVPKEEAEAGRNAFLMGHEVVQAPAVRLVASDPMRCTKDYELGPGLFRAVKGTGRHQRHLEHERLMWLDGPGVEFVSVREEWLDRDLWVKLVGGSSFISDADPERVILRGRSRRSDADCSDCHDEGGEVVLRPARDGRAHVIVNRSHENLLVRPAPGESVDHGGEGLPFILRPLARAAFFPDGPHNRTPIVGRS